MTTRRNRSEEFRSRIEPFLEEWEERGLAPWQQFRNWSVQQILWDAGLSMDEVEDITEVDGQRDEGIDAWHVDEQASPCRLILIQSKDTGIAREDFSKMKDGLLNLLDYERPRNANRSLLEKASMFRHALPEEFEVDLYLTSSMIAQQHLTPDPTGDPWNTEEMLIPRMGRRISVRSFVRDIKFLVENVQVIHENPINTSFYVERGAYFEYMVGGHTRTITAAIEAEELAYIFQQQKQNLFRRNPRYYLGITGLRNLEIKRTLEEVDNEQFYVYNNGLTCVAKTVRVDRIEDDPDRVQINVEDFQIVNGCQTTATLAEVAPRINLDKVRVLAKIIEEPHAGGEESDATSDKIATSSNSQNPMKAEDSKANDPRQKAWHNEFLRGVPAPWFYEIKRGTWVTAYKSASDRRPFRDNDTSKYRKMTMKDLGQECWAFLGYPAEAKDKARLIFDHRSTYDLVFSQTLTASQLLLPHIIYEAADARTKMERTYVLPTSDADYEQFSEVRIGTEHLRHPIVAAVGRVLCGLKGCSPAYLSPSESARLIERKSQWLDLLVDRAFSALARRLLLESARSGIGPRSVVRSNNWMNDTLHYLAERITDQVIIERNNGTRTGSLAEALPFTTSLA